MVNFLSKEKYDAEDLRRLVAVLRGPDGCPWDRVQTHASLRRGLLEECDELCEAIDSGSPEALREELGDVWLQVIFHAGIEEDAGTFNLDDVADAECRKLIGRHPHVFGGETFPGMDEQFRAWEDIKRREKAQKTLSDTLNAVCRTLPGLWRAEKLQKKAAAQGGPLPPEDPAGALRESLEALEGALASGTGAEDALGELLFCAVYAAGALGADPETVLHERCERFIQTCRTREYEAPAEEHDDTLPPEGGGNQ